MDIDGFLDIIYSGSTFYVDDMNTKSYVSGDTLIYEILQNYNATKNRFL